MGATWFDYLTLGRDGYYALVSDTHTYASLRTSSYWFWSSIWIPTGIYVYLQVDFSTLNKTIIFVIPVSDIHILPVSY